MTPNDDGSDFDLDALFADATEDLLALDEERHETSSGGSIAPDRETWTNTLAGLLIIPFALTPDEAIQVATSVRHLLKLLKIPERGMPAVVNDQLELEHAHGTFGKHIADGERFRAAQRAGSEIDNRVERFPSTVWRQALWRIIFQAYPDLDAVERFAAARTLEEIVEDLRIDQRPVYVIPSIVAVAAASD